MDAIPFLYLSASGKGRLRLREDADGQCFPHFFSQSYSWKKEHPPAPGFKCEIGGLKTVYVAALKTALQS